MKNVFVSLAMAACLICSVGNAHASNAAIQAANNQLDFLTLQTRVDYSETGIGTLGTRTGLLDTESGYVPGTGVELSYMGDALIPGLYLNLRYKNVIGHTRYVGAPITGGAYGSVVGTSTATITDYRARIGDGIPLGSNVVFTPYFEAGHHHWFRGVNAGETYKNDYIGGGAMLQTSLNDMMVLTAYGMAGRTLSPSISVAGSTGFTGPLGTSPISDVGASIDFGFPGVTNMHLNFGVDYTRFKYGISAIYAVPGGSSWEPNSKTRYTTYQFGIGYGF